MISGVTKVTLTYRRSQTSQLWQTAFRVKHEAPNIGLWGDALTSATTEFTQNLQTGNGSSHSERWGARGAGSWIVIACNRQKHSSL